MTVVLVHGNPETDAVWDPLVEALGRDDVIRLSPPGFGAPLPDGWPSTYLDYRDWLEDELSGVDGPVDLVGHDWGGNHVVNVMMHRPELVRSWVSDIIGVFDPDYVWHDAALVWQTPGEANGWPTPCWAGRCSSERTGWSGSASHPRWPPRSRPPKALRWLGHCSRCTARRATPPLPRRVGRWSGPRPDRGCACSRPRTTTSALSRSVAGLRRAREPAPRYSTGSATGGWCKIQHAARPR